MAALEGHNWWGFNRFHSFVWRSTTDQQHHEKGPSIEIRAARGQLLSDFSVTAEIWDAKPNKNLHSQTLHPLSKFATTFTFHGSSKLMDPTIKVMLAIQGQFPIFESSQRPCDHPKDAQKVPKMQTCCRMLFCSTVQSETKSFWLQDIYTNVSSEIILLWGNPCPEWRTQWQTQWLLPTAILDQKKSVSWRMAIFVLGTSNKMQIPPTCSRHRRHACPFHWSAANSRSSQRWKHPTHSPKSQRCWAQRRPRHMSLKPAEAAEKPEKPRAEPLEASTKLVTTWLHCDFSIPWLHWPNPVGRRGTWRLGPGKWSCATLRAEFLLSHHRKMKMFAGSETLT